MTSAELKLSEVRQLAERRAILQGYAEHWLHQIQSAGDNYRHWMAQIKECDEQMRQIAERNEP